MIQIHEVYPERIVFLNRDIFWSDISDGGGNGLIFPKDTMFFIFDGKIISNFNLAGYFIYVLTSLSPSAGQWLMDLTWLDLTPASINTGVAYDIHMIMEHVNKLEFKAKSLSGNVERLASINITRLRALAAMGLDPFDFDRVGEGYICPKCFMEWDKHTGNECPFNPDHIDWRSEYHKEVVAQFEKAITINEFYDGFDKMDWDSVETFMHYKLNTFLKMTPTQIADLREEIIEDKLKLFNSDEVRDYHQSKIPGEILHKFHQEERDDEDYGPQNIKKVSSKNLTDKDINEANEDTESEIY